VLHSKGVEGLLWERQAGYSAAQLRTWFQIPQRNSVPDAYDYLVKLKSYFQPPASIGACATYLAHDAPEHQRGVLLVKAVGFGHVPALKELLRNGADFRSQQCSGARHEAAGGGPKRTVKVLLVALPLRRWIG
jgi:hypothetical protein